MDKISCKFEGTMYLVSHDGQVNSFPYGFNEVSFARSEVRSWLMQRPDLCFVSVVIGSVLVAKAGHFPWHIESVSLAPLAC